MSMVEHSRLYATLPTLSGSHNRAVIDLAALRHNYRTLSAQTNGKTCICVVKADAYGHGAAAVAHALYEEGCRTFAVSCIEEAIALRPAVENADILIFGRVLGSEAALLVKHRFTATVYSPESARELADAAVRLHATIPVHIKLDTGMNRLGFPAYSTTVDSAMLSDLAALFSTKGLSVKGIYSHFACADEEDESFTHKQAARFLAVTEALETKGFSLGTKHLCNSAGTIRFADRYGLNAVRLGIALYGYPPMADATPLKPVMRLTTEVTHVHTLEPHERVGYGGSFEADEPRRIATVGIGYADGWLRAYRGAYVTVHTANGDVRAKIVGRICMDQCMLDVTDLPVKRGDCVTLFGQTAAELEELARMADTIPYECLCLISARVTRVTEK